MGGRGAGWVAGQVALGALTAAVAARGPGRTRRWGARRAAALTALGAGGALAVWAARSLGTALTPLPAPRAGASLVEAGPYRLVRHPIYTGVVVAGAAAPLAGSPLAAVPLVALARFLAAKARREEERLVARYPGYPAYRARVRGALLPALGRRGAA